MTKTGILVFAFLLAASVAISCGFLSTFAPTPIPAATEPAKIAHSATETIPPTVSIAPAVETSQPDQIEADTEPVAIRPPTLPEPGEITFPNGLSEGKPSYAEPSEVTIEVPQSRLEVQLEMVAQGFNRPLDLVTPPDQSGRFFTVDQSGVIYVIDRGWERHQEPFLDLRYRLFASGERSKMGGFKALAFHPDFAENNRFYVYYSVPFRHEAFAEWEFTDRISEFTVSLDNPNKADISSERLLLEFDPPTRDAFAVNLAFKQDGTLALHRLEGGQGTEESVLCIDPRQPGVFRESCLDTAPISQPPLDPRLAYAGAENPGVHPDVIAATKGRLYQGYVFPSLQGWYIFGGNRESDSHAVSRLFIAALTDSESQSWKLEELVYSEGESGLLQEVVNSIGQDASGELYLLTSQKSGASGTGKIYKILPKISSQRSTIEDPKEYLPLTHNYARVIRKAPVYRTLADVRNGEPFGTHGGGGNYWISVRDSATVGGRTYYRVSWGWGIFAWISGSNITFNVPLSHLRGVDLVERAGEPLAMAYQAVNIRSIPGVIADETIIGVLNPYDVVTVLEMREVEGTIWYRIGPDQWTHSNYLRVFVPSSRPEGVEADEKWVEVNLSQQVVIAHEGDTPVFATLTSTGRPGFETKKGLYRAWAVLRDGPMQWLDSKQPYSLANVPWIMYFNQGQGLHGAYWHDLFGTVRSAGCVNLSPRDSYWLFHWAGPELQPGQRVLYPGRDNPGVRVWVHDNRPDLQGLIDQYLLRTDQLPEEVASLD